MADDAAKIRIDQPARANRRAFALAVLCTAGCAYATPIETVASPRSKRDSPAGTYEAPPSTVRQQTELHLPFEGTWIVGQGYNGAETHIGYAAFALDLVKVDSRGRAHVRSGRRTKDWYGFGAEVLASAAGVVVRVVDRFPDNRVMGKALDTNSIIIQHSDAEFSEYVHLQRGSARVRVGDRVETGQPIARCGNSGAQTPHLHWALLSSIDPILTRSAVFSDFEVRDAQGVWQPASGIPRSGDVIRPR